MTIATEAPNVKLPGRMNGAAIINDPVLRLLNEQIAEARKNPEQAIAAVEMHSTSKYLFRTRPETVRQLQLRIPVLPESERNKEEVGARKHYGDEFARIYARAYTREDLERYDELVDRVGDLYITFTVVPQRHECYYETDDEMVAEFIRSVIASGRCPHLYEDMGVQYVRSRFTNAIFPDTADGKRELYLHDQAYKRAVLELKDDGASITMPDVPAAGTRKRSRTASAPAPMPADDTE